MVAGITCIGCGLIALSCGILLLYGNNKTTEDWEATSTMEVWRQKDKPIQYIECNGFSISVQQCGEAPSGVLICVMCDVIGRGMVYSNKLNIVAESPIIELPPVWREAKK